MNVSSTTTLTCELKPFVAQHLPTDDPRFSWLKRQFLRCLEDELKRIEARPEIFEILKNKQCLYHYKSI